jgi:hypothetical protein
VWGVVETILALLTYLVAFFALPAWLFWFQLNVTAFFPDFARERASRYGVVGAIWLVATIYMVWRFVLPDW